MTKVLIFGGTTEGRRACEAACARGDDVIACVTTDYGARLLPDGVETCARPMDEDEMVRFARERGIDEIVDATHPFAVAASRNIRACARRLGIPFARVLREGDGMSGFSPYITWVNTAEAAADCLSHEAGAVLLTTGSNTLSVYSQRIDPARLYARVLPTVKAMEQCEAAGILPSHIIAMQGPFSEILNGALYDELSIRHVVSKDSGDVGGVREKVMPALKRDLNVIMIKRPEE